MTGPGTSSLQHHLVGLPHHGRSARVVEDAPREVIRHVDNAPELVADNAVVEHGEVVVAWSGGRATEAPGKPVEGGQGTLGHLGEGEIKGRGGAGGCRCAAFAPGPCSLALRMRYLRLRHTCSPLYLVT